MKDDLQNQENKMGEQRKKRYLSNRDRDAFLALLDSDEEPNEALEKAAKEYKRLMERQT